MPCRVKKKKMSPNECISLIPSPSCSLIPISPCSLIPIPPCSLIPIPPCSLIPMPPCSLIPRPDRLIPSPQCIVPVLISNHTCFPGGPLRPAAPFSPGGPDSPSEPLIPRIPGSPCVSGNVNVCNGEGECSMPNYLLYYDVSTHWRSWGPISSIFTSGANRARKPFAALGQKW